jgi:hypothetical protein
MSTQYFYTIWRQNIHHTKKNNERKHYYYYYNSSLALNLKQCYSKRFTVHKIQYTCTIKHISRIDKMR